MNCLSRCKDISRQHPLWVVLVVSGLGGFLLGWLRAEYQWSVEPALVMAKLVEYPVAENAFNVCSYKNWTLVNQLCALFLYLGVTEITLSYWLSAFCGLFCFQGSALLLFFLSRHAWFAALGPFFLFQVYGIMTHGITYPILMLGSGQIYGMLGLSLSLMVLGLYACRFRRTALFLLGIGPAIHPSQGLWLAGYFGLALLFTFGWKGALRHYWRSFAPGAGLAAISLAIHLKYFYWVPVIDPSLLAQYQIALRDFWSEHYKPFFLRSGQTYTVFGVTLFALAAFHWRLLGATPRTKVILFSVLASVALAAMFSWVYWVPSAHLYKYYIILMMYPGRTFNLSIYLAGVLVLGLLGRRTGKYGAWFWVALIPPLFLASGEIVRNRVALAVVVFLFAMGARLLYERRLPRSTPLLSVNLGSWLAIWLIPVAVFQLLLAINQYRISRDTYFLDYTNNDFYRKMNTDQGGMIVPGSRDMGNLLARSRRPILYLDGPLILNYAPEAAENFGAVFREVYGVDFLNPPKNLDEYGRGLPSPQVRELWAKRSRAEWQQLAKKFHFSHVVEHTDYPLPQLSLVASNGQYNYYAIPSSP